MNLLALGLATAGALAACSLAPASGTTPGSTAGIPSNFSSIHPPGWIHGTWSDQSGNATVTFTSNNVVVQGKSDSGTTTTDFAKAGATGWVQNSSDSHYSISAPTADSQGTLTTHEFVLEPDGDLTWNFIKVTGGVTQTGSPLTLNKAKSAPSSAVPTTEKVAPGSNIVDGAKLQVPFPQDFQLFDDDTFSMGFPAKWKGAKNPVANDPTYRLLIASIEGASHFAEVHLHPLDGVITLPMVDDFFNKLLIKYFNVGETPASAGGLTCTLSKAQSVLFGRYQGYQTDYTLIGANGPEKVGSVGLIPGSKSFLNVIMVTEGSTADPVLFSRIMSTFSFKE